VSDSMTVDAGFVTVTTGSVRVYVDAGLVTVEAGRVLVMNKLSVSILSMVVETSCVVVLVNDRLSVNVETIVVVLVNDKSSVRVEMIVVV
jgi:hypothetical protein